MRGKILKGINRGFNWRFRRLKESSSRRVINSRDGLVLKGGNYNTLAELN
jgi:hypothetical protein